MLERLPKPPVTRDQLRMLELEDNIVRRSARPSRRSGSSRTASTSSFAGRCCSVAGVTRLACLAAAAALGLAACGGGDDAAAGSAA